MPNIFGYDNNPQGKATLSVSPTNQLIVSNLGASGLDGVSILTNGAKNFAIDFDDIRIDSGVMLGASFNITDAFNRVKTVSQWALVHNPTDGNVYLYANSRLMGAAMAVTGFYQGKMVFSKAIPTPKDANSNWVWVVVGLVSVAVGWVASRVDYHSVTTTSNAGGHTTTTTTTTTSFGGKNMPVNTDFPVSTDPLATILCDELFVTSSIEHGPDYPQDMLGDIKEVIFTATGIPSIKITNEQNW